MNKKPQKRGMALVTVLTIISIIGLLAGVVGTHAGLMLNGKSDSRAVEQAYFVAYGGLQRTLVNLRKDPNYPGGSDKPFPGGGQYTVSIHKNTKTVPKKTPAGITIPPGTTLVYCVGESGQIKQALAGTIAASSNNESDYAVLANTFNSLGGVVDAFTSSGACCDISSRQAKPGAGDIASLVDPADLVENPWSLKPTNIDGTVAGTNVDGDITTPDPGAYNLDANSSLLGETVLKKNPVYDPALTPAYLGGDDEQASTGTVKFYPGHYESMHFDGDSIVQLKPGDYYISGNLEMWQDARIECPWGKVTLHIDGLFAMAEHASINVDNDPRDLKVVLTGPVRKHNWLPWSHNFTLPTPHNPGGNWSQGWLADESQLFGELIGPDANVLVSGDVYGRVRADRIKLLGDAKSGGIHYYTNLGGVGALGGGNFVFDRIWRVH